MKLRLIERIGTRVSLRIYWKAAAGESCQGTHNAMRQLVDLPVGAPPPDDEPGVHPNPASWPDRCERCGAPVPEGHFLNTSWDRYQEGAPMHQVFHARLYNTASGEPEPGDCFWAPWYHGDNGYCPWDNCNDPRGHLMVVLPNGRHWDLDSRASNCTMPDDRTHRCWIRHGEPPELHVDKSGHTCQAGAGSILSGSYHGFLHHGELIEC